MAESYDEFVFTNPTEALHTLLMSGAKQKFDNHPLNQWFTTPQLVEKEQTELDQLARASKMVTQKIEDLRFASNNSNVSVELWFSTVYCSILAGSSFLPPRLKLPPCRVPFHR